MLRRRIKWVVTRRTSEPSRHPCSDPPEKAVGFCDFLKRKFQCLLPGTTPPHVIKSPNLQRDSCTSELSPPVKTQD